MNVLDVWNSISGLCLGGLLIVTLRRFRTQPYPVLMGLALGTEAAALELRVGGADMAVVGEGLHILAAGFLLAWATRRFVGNLSTHNVS